MPTKTTPVNWTEIAAAFATPPREFSPVPIWWWSGDRLERGRMRWQMEQLIAGGVYNVVILNLAPTSPLYGADPDQPAFMSDAWWEIFLGVCEDARAIGMRLWFYDQIGFSGANLQGELVRAEPSFAGQSLASLMTEGESRLELECPFEGTPLAAAYVPLNVDGSVGAPVAVPLDGRKAAADATGNKRLRLIYAIQRGFDYFNTAACDHLLDTVHREFERRARQFFGDVIVGSFQDELPTLPTWGAGFAAGFQALKGYDLRDHLMDLFEGQDDDAESVRRDYHDARALLAERAFFKPFFDWHRQFGLVCGFDQQGPARAGEPIGGVRLYADYLLTHRWYDAPGSDHHGSAKIHSSLAHLYDRPRVWIESFHSSGWGGTLEETFDWLLPWLRAGATLYNPHAVYYGTWGGWWEWAPPSTCWRQPYWRHYALFANAVSRLCYLLSQGSHVCDIAILYPTATIQASLTIERTLPDAETANRVYETLVGHMMFMEFQAGTLDADRRDFDVIDDASLQNAVVEGGALVVGAERFPVLILPACAVLEAATAARIIEFIEAGGMLFAVGSLPRHVLGGSPDALAQLFTSGRATFVASPDELPAALSALPRRVEAPVPVLQRRIDNQDVIFIPAAFPHASRSESAEATWLKAEYSFDPARYAASVTLRVRGASGTPHLWDVITGQRHPLPATVAGDVSIVEVPFDSSPAALVVFSSETAAPVPVPDFDAVFTFPDVWSCRLEPTLDNRYGDFTKPNTPGAPPVQTWAFAHAVAPEPPAEKDWQPVQATFGAYGEWTPTGAEDWRPAVYSLSRGIRKDALHVPTLGPKGHVPEEFLDFGAVAAGGGVRFRTGIWLDAPRALTLAIAAPARKQAGLNGQPLGSDVPGYLWQTPIQLNAGLNALEFTLTADTGGDLRAYWALVTDPAKFARPERMTAVDTPRRDSRLRFSLTFDIPFEPVEFTVQVSADSPCRVLVNGVEAGRQGGFDPYASLARVQPYTVRSAHQGSNTITLDVQDIGAVAVALADGLIRGAGGESLTITYVAGGQARRWRCSASRSSRLARRRRRATRRMVPLDAAPRRDRNPPAGRGRGALVGRWRFPLHRPAQGTSRPYCASRTNRLAARRAGARQNRRRHLHRARHLRNGRR